MFEIQFRIKTRNKNVITRNPIDSFHTWSELGHFKTVALAMDCILHEMNGNVYKKTKEDFVCNSSEKIYELPGQHITWQFKFVKVPESPWKIGLNDV